VKRPRGIYTVLAVLVMAASANVSAEEISAEDAKYKALYLLAMDPPDYYGEGYIERISTPKIYYSWDRSRKYYVFYTYIGPGDMPTWADLEKYARDNWAHAFEKKAKPQFDISRIDNFVIPASKKEYIYNPNPYGPPRVILGRGLADWAIKLEYPDMPYEYTRTVIELHEPFFEYRFKGPLKIQIRYVWHEHVYTLKELGWGVTSAAEKYKKRERDIKLPRIFKSHWLDPNAPSGH